MMPEKRGGWSIPPELMTPSNAAARLNDLYKATMRNQWDEVIEILKENSTYHAAELTKSMATPLHAAIATYSSRTPSSSHEMHLKKMIELMKVNGTLERVLAKQNHKGDTPLHLAAAVGWQPIFDSMKEIDFRDHLLYIRNKKSETPLFLAALHGNFKVFRFLCDRFDLPTSVARVRDGNTILHRAIFEENLGEYLLVVYPEFFDFGY